MKDRFWTIVAVALLALAGWACWKAGKDQGDAPRTLRQDPNSLILVLPKE